MGLARSWPDFFTCGMSARAQLRQDATQPFPELMRGKIDFIWSERMLEHIPSAKFHAFFKCIAEVLSPGGRCRLCVPICFWGTPTINMLRAGNAEKQRTLGHVSWFTYIGYGDVAEDCFGASGPPGAIALWPDNLIESGLTYIPVRHYDAAGNLFYDRRYMETPMSETFLDEPGVKIHRPDSLIFDLVNL